MARRSTRAVVGKAYAGALAGESLAELLTSGELAYLANERVTGTLDGRSGTFVLQHGAWEGGQWGYVVPGSGTGELAGLRGTAMMEHGRSRSTTSSRSGAPARTRRRRTAAGPRAARRCRSA